MKISDLIEILTHIRERHGDVPVFACVLDDEIGRVSLLGPDSLNWQPGMKVEGVFLE